MNAVQEHYRTIRDGFINGHESSFFRIIPYDPSMVADLPFDADYEESEEDEAYAEEYEMEEADTLSAPETEATHFFYVLENVYEATRFQLPEEIAKQFGFYVHEAYTISIEGWEYFTESENYLDAAMEKRLPNAIMEYVRRNDPEDFVTVYCPELQRLRKLKLDLEQKIAAPCCRGERPTFPARGSVDEEDGVPFDIEGINLPDEVWNGSKLEWIEHKQCDHYIGA